MIKIAKKYDIKQGSFFLSDFLNTLLNKRIVRGWSTDSSEKEWDDIWNSIRLMKKLDQDNVFATSNDENLGKKFKIPKKAEGKKIVFLDLDETLIHTSMDDCNGQNSLTQYQHRLEIKLTHPKSESPSITNSPVASGSKEVQTSTVLVNLCIRPYAEQLLSFLS
jgi:hypothetical protein